MNILPRKNYLLHFIIWGAYGTVTFWLYYWVDHNIKAAEWLYSIAMDIFIFYCNVYAFSFYKTKKYLLAVSLSLFSFAGDYALDYFYFTTFLNWVNVIPYVK